MIKIEIEEMTGKRHGFDFLPTKLHFAAAGKVTVSLTAFRRFILSISGKSTTQII